MSSRITKIITLILILDAALFVTNAVAGTPNGPPHLVPEPVSMSLFIAGGATIGIMKFMNRKKNSKRSK